MTNLNFWALGWTKCFGLTDFFFKPTINHRRRKVHDYFLLLLCKSSIWFTEKHIFKIIIYFLIHQNVPQIMSFHLRYMMHDGFIGQKILKLWRQESLPFSPGWAANITRIRLWTFRLPCSKHILWNKCVNISGFILVEFVPVSRVWNKSHETPQM